MMRRFAQVVLVAAIGMPAIAAADDPVERAAERAADAKKDNKPKADRPQREPTQANRPDAGDKVIPAQTGATAAPKKRHHHHPVDSDKRLHDPTDFGSR